MLSTERLRELLHYDPETGKFTRLIACGGRPVGSQAGCLREDGYVTFSIDDVLYLAHRVAWFYVHGVWPPDDTDHEDGNRQNNRIKNLRPATRGQNNENQYKPRSDNKSGYRGVSWSKGMGKWLAQIVVRGVCHNLGYFDDPLEARDAYLKGKRRLHEFATRLADGLELDILNLE